MKKLGKKIITTPESIESYCGCGGGCQYSWEWSAKEYARASGA